MSVFVYAFQIDRAVQENARISELDSRESCQLHKLSLLVTSLSGFFYFYYEISTSRNFPCALGRLKNYLG